MPIHEQIYRRMEAHPPASSLRAILAIGRACAKQSFRGWFPKVWMVLSMIPGLVGFVGIWLIAREEQRVLMFLREATNTEYQTFDDVPKEAWYRVGANLVFASITLVQGWLATVGTAVYGAGQVADDLKTRAFEVYLARPIATFEYILGKLIAILRPLLLILVLPTLFLLLVGHILIPQSLAGTLALYPVIIVAGVLYAGLNALIMLGISSLGKSARYATIIWFALYFLTMVVSQILEFATNDEIWQLVSYRANLQVLLATALDLEPLPGLELDAPSAEHPAFASFLILFGLSSASVLLVARRLRAGRLP